MKRITTVVIALLLLLLLILLWWFMRPNVADAAFSGSLRDADGHPVAGAQVSVGGQTTVTDEEGVFSIKGSWAREGRWVLDVSHPDFAPVSKVYGQGLEDLDIQVAAATVQSFDAASAIVARDVRVNCIGSIASGVDWGSKPAARFPQVFDANGDRLTGELPAAVRRLLAFPDANQPCASGFQVSIPANALVGASGQRVTGEVQVALSTVDLYSPDGMPGDYGVASAEGPAYMESFGAGTVEIRSEDEVLQLARRVGATIEIPVDQAQIDAGSKVPGAIPLLVYEPKSGDWQQIGEAKLNSERKVYVGQVSHLSEFNADVVKTNPACVRFDASGITGNFDLVITAPTSTGGYRQVTRNVAANAVQANPDLHAIFNLPANAWVALRAIKSGVPVGTWVLATGAPWGSTGAPAYDYAACGTVFNLSETLGTGVTHNGSGHQFGPLPKHVSYLVNTSGASEDVYPVGGTDCSPFCYYLFSLFDTGSNVVLLDSTLTSTHGLTLTPGTDWDVDVRVNGLSAVNASTLNAPYGQPGTSGGAQAHSDVLRIAPRSLTVLEEETRTDASGTPLGPPAVGVNYMLAGTPVAKEVVAHIDYTTTVTRGPWTFATPFIVTAPDIEFYQPGSSGIPSPALTLFLDGFGNASTPATGNVDQRYFLQNVTFTEGTNTVYDNQTPTSPVRFMYDTGTTFTVINQAMATALGVAPTSPSTTAKCSSLDTANFVTLDSVTVVGMNAANQLATYRVNNAEVCVDVAGTVITTHYPDPANPTGPALTVDAVVGSNLFDQAEVLWNGPRRTLGILP